MPTLEADLVKFAEDGIVDLNADHPFSRAEAKQLPFALMGLKPNGLKLYTVGAQWLQDFSEIFHDHKDDLHPWPWVTAYSAALGMQSVWTQIVMLWVDNPPAQDQAMHPKVRAAIDSLIPAYLLVVTPD